MSYKDKKGIARLLDRYKPFRSLSRLVQPCIPSCTVTYIPLGPNFGRKWCAGESNLSASLGIYEWGQVRRFSKLVHPDSIVYDIGANLGYYTLVASRGMRVYAIEPNPANLVILGKVLMLNHIGNALIIDKAVSDLNAVAYLYPATVSPFSQLDMAGESGSKVEVVTVDSLGLVPPTLVKIDVEGHEDRVLAGMKRTLEEARPVVFLSAHRYNYFPEALKLFPDGYRVEKLDKLTWIVFPQ